MTIIPLLTCPIPVGTFYLQFSRKCGDVLYTLMIILISSLLFLLLFQDNLPPILNKRSINRATTQEFLNYESLCRGEDVMVGLVTYFLSRLYFSIKCSNVESHILANNHRQTTYH